MALNRGLGHGGDDVCHRALGNIVDATAGDAPPPQPFSHTSTVSIGRRRYSRQNGSLERTFTVCPPRAAKNAPLNRRVYGAQSPVAKSSSPSVAGVYLGRLFSRKGWIFSNFRPPQSVVRSGFFHRGGEEGAKYLFTSLEFN